MLVSLSILSEVDTLLSDTLVIPADGRGKNTNLTAQRSNSNTVWFNFQMYVIFSINIVSLVTLISSGTDILYGCDLLLHVCIIYFISCDCIVNYSLSYTIY